MNLLHLPGGTEKPSKASIRNVSVPPARTWHLSNTTQNCYHYNIQVKVSHNRPRWPKGCRVG